MIGLRRSATRFLVLALACGLAACGSADRSAERAGASRVPATSSSAPRPVVNIDPVWSRLVSKLAATPRWHLTLTREYEGRTDLMYEAAVNTTPCTAAATQGVGVLGTPAFHQVPIPTSAPVAVPLLRGMIPHNDCNLAERLAAVVRTTSSSGTTWTGTFDEDAVQALWRAADQPGDGEAAAESARRTPDLSLTVAATGLSASVRFGGTPAVLVLTWSAEPQV